MLPAESDISQEEGEAKERYITMSQCYCMYCMPILIPAFFIFRRRHNLGLYHLRLVVCWLSVLDLHFTFVCVQNLDLIVCLF